MTSARIRGWGSYFSKKVDDTLSSLIPKPPQSEQQEADRLEANPQEANPQEANPQEANQPPSLGDACVRLGIALGSGDQHRRNQETRVPRKADPGKSLGFRAKWIQKEVQRRREFREAVQGGDEAIAAWHYKQRQELIRSLALFSFFGVFIGVLVAIIIIAVRKSGE